MGWPVLGAHISSKWWECPPAQPAAVVPDRSCVQLAVVASTTAVHPTRLQCGFESVGGWEEYRWDHGARYILNLFRWAVVGLVPAWWGPR